MEKSKITVVGLGSMGTTIAGLFLKSGAQVTVWNRMSSKADALVKLGATWEPDLTKAVSASALVVVIVSNDAAVLDLQRGMGGTIAGRTLLQLTTIGPQTARAQASWAKEHGARYVSGAIQAAPSQMGQPETPIFLSGSLNAFNEWLNTFNVLGGGLKWLGEDAGAAATMDLASLSWVYGSFIGFVQGALIAKAQGLDVGVFGQLVQDISPSFGAFFRHEGGVIESGNFAITESPLRISVDATARILEASRAMGINSEVAAFVESLFARAHHAGLGGEEAAALSKVLAPPSPATQRA